MPCYGYDRDTTPNLCEIGKENILFENAHTNATWTLPSHASIFTGMFPFVHKITKAYDNYLNKEIPLLPEILQNNGYETFFFAPKQEVNIPPRHVYNRGITYWDDTYRDDKYTNDTDKYITKAINQLTENSAENKKSFVFFHSYACHGPYYTENQPLLYTKNIIPSLPLNRDDVAKLPFTEGYYKFLLKRLPEGLRDGGFYTAPEKIEVFLENLQNAPNFLAAKRIYDDATSHDWWGETMMGDYQEEFGYWSKINLGDPEYINYIKALYDQGLHVMDEKVLGALRNSMNSSQWPKNTIVIITADHGEEFMEHGVLMHATLYDYNTQVPLIFVVPGIQQKYIQEHVQSVDIAPTILDLVGIQNSYSFNGKNLTPLLYDKSLGKRLIITGGNGYNQPNLSTIREGDWKVFVTENEDQSVLPYALYNTKSDPGEQSDLLAKNIQKATQILTSYKALKEKLTPKDKQAN